MQTKMAQPLCGKVTLSSTTNIGSINLNKPVDGNVEYFQKEILSSIVKINPHEECKQEEKEHGPEFPASPLR